MARVKGSGSKDFWSQLVLSEDSSFQLWNGDTEVVPLRVVNAYQHMGGFITPSGDMRLEARHRASETLQSFRKMRKPVFANADLSVACRLSFHKSMLIPKLIYNTATWTTMDPKHVATLGQAYISPLRTIADCENRKEKANTTDAEVLSKLHVHGVTAVINRYLIRYLLRLMQLDIPQLWRLILLQCQSKQGWTARIADALQYVFLESPDLRESMPSPKDDVAHWLHSISSEPRAWASVLLSEQLWDRVEARVRDRSTVEGALNVRCDLCGAICKGSNGLHGHMAAKHHVTSWVKTRIFTTNCLACNLECHSRSRLHHHVAYRSGACALFYWSEVPGPALDDTEPACFVSKRGRPSRAVLPLAIRLR